MKPENMVQQAKTAIGNAAHQAFNAQLQKIPSIDALSTGWRSSAATTARATKAR